MSSVKDSVKKFLAEIVKNRTKTPATHLKVKLKILVISLLVNYKI